MSTSRRVVVIGGGVAGYAAAQALDTPHLTLITPRDHFQFIKYGALRASVANDDNWRVRVLPDSTKALKNGKTLIGKVVGIDDEKKLVKVLAAENTLDVPYDALIIASGSRNFSPAEPPINVTSKNETMDYYREMKRVIDSSESICIVGGGPVSIELVGEIYDFAKDGSKKKLVVVTKAPTILNNTQPPLKLSQINEMTKMLGKMGVEIVANDEVVNVEFPKHDLRTAHPLVETNEGVTLKSGKKLECSLLIWCVGSMLNTDFVPENWLDSKTREIVVDVETLRVQGTSSVFAVGDAARTQATKLGYIAMIDGPIAAKNVLDVMNGKNPSHRVQRDWTTKSLVVPVGARRGRVFWRFIGLGDWAASWIKGKDLYEAMCWGALNAGKPPNAKF